MTTTTSVITSKFQTTIPKIIRENLKLSVSDTLSWEIEDGKISVSTTKKSFLAYKNSIRTGPGDTRDDIEIAKNLRMERYR